MNSPYIGEKCAVWGICIHPNHYSLFRKAIEISGLNLPTKQVTASVTVYGLHNLQHRGQDSTGIATYDGKEPHIHKDMGLVLDVFYESIINALPGNYAIGHNRYGTHGPQDISSAQPLEEIIEGHHVLYGHNGQFTNYYQERQRLEAEGSQFKTNVDSELALQLLKRTDSNMPLRKRVEQAYSQIEGSQASVLLGCNTIIGYRDKRGVRPLILARVKGMSSKNESYIIASEDGGIRRLFFYLPQVRINYSEVKPGEIVQIIDGKLSRKRVHICDKLGYCIFEIVYLAREDAHIFGVPVAEFRREAGRQLARELRIKADYVVPVLDSGLKYAEGFSEESGIPLHFSDFRDHHFRRGFIGSQGRDLTARNKCVPIEDDLNEKSVVVVDDTEMRGDTTREKSIEFSRAGAKEIHWAYCFPEVISPCHLGVDFQSIEELIAANLSVKERISYLPKKVKSINHISFDGLKKSIDKVAPGQSKNFSYECIGY